MKVACLGEGEGKGQACSWEGEQTSRVAFCHRKPDGAARLPPLASGTLFAGPASGALKEALWTSHMCSCFIVFLYF